MHLRKSSDTSLAIPYGSTGYGGQVSRYGNGPLLPYRDIELANTNLFIVPLATAAVAKTTVDMYVFRFTTHGEKTDNPSCGLAAQ
jgi:hypothetical protein